MNTELENIKEIENTEENSLKAYWIWYIISVIFFIFAFVYLSQANDYIDNSAKMMSNNDSGMSQRYVGGDAYNYIIAGTYSTTISIRALIFCILGIGSIIIGKISSQKIN